MNVIISGEVITSVLLSVVLVFLVLIGPEMNYKKLFKLLPFRKNKELHKINKDY